MICFSLYYQIYISLWGHKVLMRSRATQRLFMFLLGGSSGPVVPQIKDEGVN